MATVVRIHAYVTQEDGRPILVPRARPVSPIPLPSRRSPENLLRAPRVALSSQSNVIHLLTPLSLQEIIFLLRRRESKATRDFERDTTDAEIDDRVDLERGNLEDRKRMAVEGDELAKVKLADMGSKKEIMRSKRKTKGEGRVLRTRRSEDPDRVGVRPLRGGA